MVLKSVFQRLAKQTSYTFAIVFFSLCWAIIPAYYAMYFSWATFDQTREINLAVICALVTSTLVIAMLIHGIQFGLFHRFGCSGLARSTRRINNAMQDENVFVNHSSIATRDLERIYTAMVRFPVINFISASMYALGMLLVILVAYYFYTGSYLHTSLIILGGVYAAFIYGYFTFTITEFFVGSAKSRMEDLLFQRSREFRVRHVLSFTSKSLITLLLISLNMVVLAVIIWQSEKPLWQVGTFILVSIVAIGYLIYFLVSGISLSLRKINQATRDLASGGRGFFFPPFSDRELATFATNYNTAALEIYKIRADLAKNVAERTEAIVVAYGKLNNAYSRIQEEMQLAKKIQNSILPRNFDGLQGVKLYIHYYPMSEIGGDIYDIHENGPRSYRIFLADATGHGVQAALVTMIIKGEYEKIKKLQLPPSELLNMLNKNFVELYEFLNVFFTCIIIDIDMVNKRVLYASAGHPDQVYIHGGTVTFLHSTGKIIGVLKDTVFQDLEFPVSGKDRILLFTDGIFEQFDEGEDVYGEERLKKSIIKASLADMRGMLTSMVNDLQEFLSKKSKLSKDDDITLIGVEIMPDQST